MLLEHCALLLRITTMLAKIPVWIPSKHGIKWTAAGDHLRKHNDITRNTLTILLTPKGDSHTYVHKSGPLQRIWRNSRELGGGCYSS